MLWFWRCAFDYTYGFNNKEFIIEGSGFGFKRVYKYPFEQIDSFRYEGKQKLFGRDVISRYVSRFSSSDANDLRLLIFNKNGKLLGIKFKSTDLLLDKLKALKPEKFRLQAKK